MSRIHEALKKAELERAASQGGLPQPNYATEGPAEPSGTPRVEEQPVEAGAAELHGALIAHETGDRVDEGGLARAIRADEADQFALVDLQVNPGHCADPAETDRHATRIEYGSYRRRRPSAEID